MKPVMLRLVRGDTSRELTPEDLAGPLQVPAATLRGALLGLMLRPTLGDVSREEQSRARGSEGPVNVNGEDVNGNGAQENISFGSVNVNVAAGSDSDNQEELPEDAHALAMQIAEALGDGASLPWYRHVAETLSPVLIRDALLRARTVPAPQIRKSRAAYFTHIVTPFMRRARSQKPYADPPSSTP